MKIPKLPWRTVVLPSPLTPLVVFAHVLLTRATYGGARLLDRHYVRWATNPSIPTQLDQYPFAVLGPIINLNREKADILQLIKDLMELQPCLGDKTIGMDVANFFTNGD